MMAAGYTIDRVPAYLNSDSVSVKAYAALPAGCSVYVPWGMLAVPVGIPARWSDGLVSYFVQLLNCVEDMVEVASVSAVQQIKCWVEMSLACDLKVAKQSSAQAKMILDEAQGMKQKGPL